MKEAKELSAFLARMFAVFLAMNLAAAIAYVGSVWYSSYCDRYFKYYTKDISYIAENYPDTLIDNLADNGYVFDTTVVTTKRKSDFARDNIKKIELIEEGSLYVTVYFKGGFVSFNPKWILPKTMEIKDVRVKYINRYNQTFQCYNTTAVLVYNDRQYSILAFGEKTENINQITEIIKAMV